MSQQTGVAKLATVKSAVDGAVSGQKLRLVGRTEGLVLLVEEEQALLVDVSFCVDTRMGEWVRDRHGKVMVLGHLEAVSEELPIPMLPTYVPAPSLNPMLVLRAVLVEQCTELDMSAWYKEIEERNREGHSAL
ncbi:hypothetical protein H0H93_007807 [Arthromyces matolae]|nr:hypothetical protein H0H93_007807 [Arthromyces matolae]